MKEDVYPWITDHYIQLMAVKDKFPPYLVWNFYDNGTFNQVLPVQRMPHIIFIERTDYSLQDFLTNLLIILKKQ